MDVILDLLIVETVVVCWLMVVMGGGGGRAFVAARAADHYFLVRLLIVKLCMLFLNAAAFSLMTFAFPPGVYDLMIRSLRALGVDGG